MSYVSKPYVIILIVLLLISLYIRVGYYDDLMADYYEIKSSKVPRAFDGFIIAQVSDLHSELFGDNQSEIIEMLKKGKPDIIVLTGDIIDRRDSDYANVVSLFENLVDIAPVYAIYGNHEFSNSGKSERLPSIFEEYGIVLLNDESQLLSKDGQQINLIGFGDNSALSDYRKLQKYLTENLQKPEVGAFNILLYHRANQFDYIAGYGYDLVLSGHNHGGIIRLPFVGGLISPDEMTGRIGHFLPRYSGGMYVVGNSTLISNRGLAETYGVHRFYNRPEIVFVILRSEDDI